MLVVLGEAGRARASKLHAPQGALRGVTVTREVAWPGKHGPMVGLLVGLVLPGEVPTMPPSTGRQQAHFRASPCRKPRGLVITWEGAVSHYWCPHVDSLTAATVL